MSHDITDLYVVTCTSSYSEGAKGLMSHSSNNTLIKSSNLYYVAPVDDAEIVKTTTSCFPPSEIMDFLPSRSL